MRLGPPRVPPPGKRVRRPGEGVSPALVLTLPPMWQLPLAPRSSGMIHPAGHTCASSAPSTHPACATSVPLACSKARVVAWVMMEAVVLVDGGARVQWVRGRTGSKARTLFMRPVCSTTSSKTGTPPPTRPVLPPWGTTASRRAAQCLITAETCSVLAGRSTRELRPSYLRIQSLRGRHMMRCRMMCVTGPRLQRCLVCTAAPDGVVRWAGMACVPTPSAQRTARTRRASPHHCGERARNPRQSLCAPVVCFERRSVGHDAGLAKHALEELHVLGLQLGKARIPLQWRAVQVLAAWLDPSQRSVSGGGLALAQALGHSTLQAVQAPPLPLHHDWWPGQHRASGTSLRRHHRRRAQAWRNLGAKISRLRSSKSSTSRELSSSHLNSGPCRSLFVITRERQRAPDAARCARSGRSAGQAAQGWSHRAQPMRARSHFGRCHQARAVHQAGRAYAYASTPCTNCSSSLMESMVVRSWLVAACLACWLPWMAPSSSPSSFW